MVCVCECVSECMYIPMCSYMHMNSVWSPEVGIFHGCLSPQVLRQVFHLNPELTNLAS